MEVKTDYTKDSGIDDKLIAKSSLLNDFEFTDNIAYDQKYEVDALGTSTGGIYRTNRSGTRVEINNIDNALYVYVAGTKRLTVNPIGFGVYDSDGTLTGRIYSVSLVAKEVTLDNTYGTVSLIGTSAGAGDNTLMPNGDGIIDLGGGSNRWLNVAAVRYYSQTAYWEAGAGDPENVVTAPVGSLWSRTNGGAGTTLYVKETGAGNTGWAAK